MGWREWLSFPVKLVETPEGPRAKDGPLKCTYCGGTKFFKGPSGGMSTNILCANPECRHWFNYNQGILPMDDLNRVEPTEAEKEAERRKHDTEKDEAFAARVRQGYEHYKDGGTTILRLSQRERGFTYPRHEQIDQLCGFMDAMCDELRTLREKVAEHELKLTTTVFVSLDTLEHRQMGTGELLGHVVGEMAPAYGPGSITDASRYTKSNFNYASNPQFYRGWNLAIETILDLAAEKWVWSSNGRPKLGPDEIQQLKDMKKRE